MKIAFYKAWSGTMLDKLISILTLSKYSHCEIVFDDGICASSSIRDGGIRFKYITLDDKWDVFELSPSLDLDVYAIITWFNSNINDTYDWPGAIGSLFGVNLTSDNKKFCSYACARVLDLNPIVTPGGLYKTLYKTDLIKRNNK